jgi:hypothetical protein
MLLYLYNFIKSLWYILQKPERLNILPIVNVESIILKLQSVLELDGLLAMTFRYELATLKSTMIRITYYLLQLRKL